MNKHVNDLVGHFLTCVSISGIRPQESLETTQSFFYFNLKMSSAIFLSNSP